MGAVGHSKHKADPALVKRSLRTIRALLRPDVPLSVESCSKLIKHLGKAKCLPAVFEVLEVMHTRRLKASDETYEFLTNAAVRSVDFIKGAVSMETLPEQALPEACFVGRSNVGKSSLVNMICNRKSVAFTSKRPGKTQQFNYFVVNNGTADQFHLVDVPGVGYAKVPVHVQREWTSFFMDYLLNRPTLRVLFHLIDCRLGPNENDLELISLVRQAPSYVKYVVVLTKADKKKGRVSEEVKRNLKKTMEENGVGDAPVVTTSAESRLGRDDMWRYLKLAATGGLKTEHK